MKVFTILCPTDFSECSLNAIEYAAKLGEKYKARLCESIVCEIQNLAILKENTTQTKVKRANQAW